MSAPQLSQACFQQALALTPYVAEARFLPAFAHALFTQAPIVMDSASLLPVPLIINHKVNISGGPSSWPLTVECLDSRRFVVCSKNCTLTFHGDLVADVINGQTFWEKRSNAMPWLMIEVHARLVCFFMGRLLCCACTPAAPQGTAARAHGRLEHGCS